ncbi:MAG TPA: genetic competence negative regulator [Bacillota bacterium]|nr:genetic competence negative regulator [Bacillota bacterium]
MIKIGQQFTGIHILYSVTDKSRLYVHTMIGVMDREDASVRIERLSQSEFTIFLTFEDLIERGFTKDDLWHDASNVRTLFSDMVHEASAELGIELEGFFLVQVYLMQAQGMHVVVTKKVENTTWNEDFIEMKVTLDESKEIIFAFEEFEHVIQLTPYLHEKHIYNAKVYYMNGHYYMLLMDPTILAAQTENIIAIMSEFASPSIVTSHRLQEYGKVIYETNAIQHIHETFIARE